MRRHRLAPKISYEQIQHRVQELAHQISEDYQGREVVLVGVLKGAFIFMADLVRHLQIPAEVDFIRVASYGNATKSSGRVVLKKDVECPLEGKDVIIVEDIVDSGITLSWLLEHLRERKPRSLKVCALIDKYECREVEVPVDYIGIQIPGGFVVGYGLDFAERYRELQGIYEVVFVDEEDSTS
ncbi:hypoxanthine phosphoribosyltransferase [Desulfacinum hydrothermale DSM 13146]|uniref:Hypoxanthine phosphoribosyltransferase n=1 Tax=Desulfacinum hydrothermale DSM 13146 TaxID=1121390 RepID=A0A1W1XEX0_9BACT|nr:hypoxanthine phosphoribosyltransferase [Desulfacinum hydrothermale]SMC22469.1 hypoxanthine phosphoribosyltransferase [Desulfacinum hydrothermale DSM 13146]